MELLLNGIFLTTPGSVGSGVRNREKIKNRCGMARGPDHCYSVMPWCFIATVLKLANVKLYVRNGYDGDSETVNVLARHTALKR